MTAGGGDIDVSVIIPSIGSRGSVHGVERVFVVDAVRSVLRTAGMPVEVIVVSGRNMPDVVSAELHSLGDAVRLVDYDAEFNFSATVTSAPPTPWGAICCCSTMTPR
jgi:O-antigen biosynthesis protein